MQDQPDLTLVGEIDDAGIEALAELLAAGVSPATRSFEKSSRSR